MDRVDAITCLSWVPRGVAKCDPYKVEITKEELEKIIQETKENVEVVESEEQIKEEKYTELEQELLAKDVGVQLKKNLKISDDQSSNNKMDAEEDVEKQYTFEEYENETPGESDLMLKLGKLTVHSTAEDDPYIEVKEDYCESEKNDQKILPSDNLIAVGHIDEDAAVLEVYVYNSEERNLYIHHDILLPAVPLCMEWLNFDPGMEDLSPGNLLAVGSMSPVIEVWDLDLVDSLEPAFRLGSKAKKQEKVSGTGHKNSVLCLAWNREMDHILASGSVDETVILWDIQEYKMAQKMTCFQEKVQALQWHKKESHALLTGSSDKNVYMFDCRTQDTYKNWTLSGEVECVSWDVTLNQPFTCYAGTDDGKLYCIDARKDSTPVWKVKAHSGACSGLSLSSQCPGCLITISEDKLIKIWDVTSSPSEPVLVHQKDPKLGVLHTVTASPNDAFVFSFGGDNFDNNFKVWDIRWSKAVRQTFCPRMNLPVDEDGEDGTDSEADDIESENELEKMEIEDLKGAFAKTKGSSSKGDGAAAQNPSQDSPKKVKKKKRKAVI